jgi:hypothetical protein
MKDVLLYGASRGRAGAEDVPVNGILTFDTGWRVCAFGFEPHAAG